MIGGRVAFALALVLAAALALAPPAAKAADATSQAVAAATGGGFGGGAFGGVRPRIEALLGPDQLDQIYSIATTAEARLRSAIEGVRARDGAFLAARRVPRGAARWKRDAYAAMRPIWLESVQQIDAILSPQQQAQIAAERDRFHAGHERMRVNDPPLPGGYAGVAAAPSNDVGGFVLRALLRARAPE